MRRFIAGIRAVTSALVAVLILSRVDALGAPACAVLLSYCIWSGYVLWSEARGQAPASIVWYYWLDVAWACAMLKLLETGTMMLVVTMVSPIVVVSIGYSVRQGLLLAVLAALGIAYDSTNYLMNDLTQGWNLRLPAIMSLLLVPMAALVARPMNVLRQRIAFIGDLAPQLDSRRGLEPTCAEMVERLRVGTMADVVALVLPSEQGAPAMLATPDDGSFRAKADVHAKFDSLLAGLPDSALSYVRRPWWDLRRAIRVQGHAFKDSESAARVRELCELLDMRSLHVIPLTRYERRQGYFLVAYGSARAHPHDVAALAGAAPELLRIIEQAALVDQLQDETAAHERARIGRDLHDSAIQPYLGLKYAVESVALRIPSDNPARGELDTLAELVNSEVSALRELISGLRTGNNHGDNALVPAVRRQVRRFGLLFGIEVEVDSPDALTMSRATASALFHMVNESLNNIRKHSNARHVWITLAMDEARFTLTVRDDAGTVSGHRVDGFNPVSLTERVAELNGSLVVSSPDGLNNELLITIPM